MHMPHACEPLLAGWIASASIQQCMPGTTQPNNDRTHPSPASNCLRGGLLVLSSTMAETTTMTMITRTRAHKQLSTDIQLRPLTTTAPLPPFKCETEGTNFFHFIFYFIIYMLARRHLALRGALSTLEYMYIRSLDRLSAGLVSTGPATGKQLRWTGLCRSGSRLCRYVE